MSPYITIQGLFQQRQPLLKNYIIANQIQQKQRPMHEYESNIDFIDIFHLLTLNHPQESQMISMNSQISEPSHFHLQDQSQNLQQKLEVPTTDKVDSRLGGGQLQYKCEGLPTSKTIDFRWQVRSRYEQVRQGSKDDTVELNINFKTILVNYFKELLLVNELSDEEAQLVLEFSARSPSFKSLQAFFCNPKGSSRISSQCGKIIDSSLIIRRILQSRCRMSTKMQMIKFVEVLRTNINSGGNIKRWKQAARK